MYFVYTVEYTTGIARKVLMSHAKMTSQHHDAFYFEMHGFVCDDINMLDKTGLFVGQRARFCTIYTQCWD